ncbi:MAG: NADPH:quinone reductase [Micromonosporaceae bacterium]|nr:NADPH:quinone reductase [Micromonosporaceae bacterium]
MRAAYLTELGGPEVIRVGELPQPRPGPTDVLVRVEAVGVNMVDTFIRSGAYRTPIPMPFIVGRDMVGTVDGQRVWTNSLGHAGRQGPTAEYAVVPAERLYPLPAGVDPVDAVAVVHPAATAWLALVRHARVRPAERLLVEGAAGNVGRALVELGAQLGAYVVATANPADHDELRRLGAAEVIDYRAPDIGDEYHVAVDCSGRNELARTAELMTLGGRIVLVAGMASTLSVAARAIYLRDLSVLGFVISNATAADLASAAGWINDRLARGGLRPRAVRTVGLAETAEAHRMVADRVRGRVVIQPWR